MSSPSPRGSVLLVVVVVLLVLAVIGAGIMTLASRETVDASAAQRQQALVACAEAGRQLLLSRFRTIGTPPTSIQPLDESIDTAGRLRVVGGHFDTTGIQVTQVTGLPEFAFGVDRGAVQSLTNRIVGTGGGAKPLKVVVHCQQGGTPGQPASGRQLEVEFGLRFGL